MNGLVIFLGALLVILLSVAIVLVVLIINITRKISHAQQNVKTIRQKVTELSDIAKITSSVATLVGGFVAKYKKQRKGSHDRSQNETTSQDEADK